MMVLFGKPVAEPALTRSKQASHGQRLLHVRLLYLWVPRYVLALMSMYSQSSC
jgi:hypothetical protein